MTMATAAIIDHGREQKADFVKFLEDEEFSDVVFVLDGDQRFHAHRSILAARSEYFRRMFQTAMRESSEKEIRLKETPAEAFKALLRYLYTGEVDLSKMAPESVIDLVELANKYLCYSLEAAIVDYLKSIFSPDTVCRLLNSTFIHCIPSFLEECLQFVDQYAPEVLKSSNFNSMDAEALELILQRESFYANEEAIFDAIDEWMEANSTLSKEEQKRILGNVRLHQVPTEKIKEFAERTGLLTEAEIVRASPRWIEPLENVATKTNGAKVIAGRAATAGAIDAFLDGKTEIFTKDHKVYYHHINRPEDSITIELSRPYVIGSVRFLLFDLDPQYSYSYYVESSLNGTDWIRVVDKTNEECKSWQDLEFAPRPLKFIKIVGTNMSVNGNYGFHVFQFESPSNAR